MSSKIQQASCSMQYARVINWSDSWTPSHIKMECCACTITLGICSQLHQPTHDGFLFSRSNFISNFSLGDYSKPMSKLPGCHNSNLMRKQQSTSSGCLSKFESGTPHRAHKAHRRQWNNANTQTLRGLTFVATRCPHSESKIQPKRKIGSIKSSTRRNRGWTRNIPRPSKS